ncbi:Lysine-sensitive aspartokinase 3 [Enhygromyxa salina]|uniref:Aspartokinase n=1 Tax=Enhygromyxa salina TaxID=215803 RepID=A0A2S9YDZ4_9BACT|nr:aspartate kinase [Enhygromyxa salina]PRQ03315.1 Lysine-sensitive aspartokinase 3 [Enhygromyxa salina]
MIVMKFGGSSVANRGQIEKVLAIVRSARERAPVVVSSAHKGITDALVNAAKAAASGELDSEQIAPIERQRELLAELECPPDLLDPFFAELGDLLRGISLVKELSPRSLDYVSSFGERMSVRAIADFMTRNGLPARAHDVWELGFVTNSKFGRARPVEGWELGCREAFARLPADEVPIVTGFVGKNDAGEITTVGRNGSDLTASLLGGALAAEEVQIWTDTDGVMTADPSVVTGARNIPHMRFDEAAELAYFGSRVLHPSTLLPAMSSDIPVRVLNTNRPEHCGTVIETIAAPNPSATTSIAYKEGQSVLVLRTTRMFAQVGFLARVFEVLGRHRVDVDMISTSEVSISLTSANRPGLEAAAAELRADGEVELHHGRAILVVVGRHLPERPGLGVRILQGVAGAGVNVEMISYGMDSINFTMLINDADIGRAVAVLHEMLFEPSGPETKPGPTA